MDAELPVGPVTAQIGQSQQRVTLIEGPRDLVALMDTLMVADMVAFVAQGEEDMDAKSMHLLHTAKLYGLPAATLVVVQGVDSMPAVKRAQVLRTWEAGMAQATGREVKVVGQSADDANTATRFMSNTKIPERPSWHSHPLVLGERVQRAPDDAQPGDGDVLIGVSGYVRGSALNPNQLIHIPSQGSYQISKITVHSDPCPVGKGAAATMARDEDLLPDAPEDLTMEHPVDDMDADQTWPTEEELHGAKQRVRAPRGAGDYQASWFHSIDDEQGAAGGFDEADEDEMGDEEEEDDESDVSEPPEEVILDEDDDDDDAMTEAGGETMVGGEDFLSRRSRAKEDKEFPDEVDTPTDQPARVRFQKFRGLKSFRTSPWDPYENLPVDYQKISTFKNIMASRLRARAEGKVGVQPGKFVTVWVRVPMAFADKALEAAAAAEAETYQPLVLGGLLKYENKMAMMHYNVTRVRDDGDVIKSKDTLVLICGMRRMEVRPVFSECKGSDKHKLLRFLPPKSATFASCYAPVQWAPAPVLIMKKQRSGVLTLVAAGRVAAPDANRITLKRIVLTALPYKIKKRKATCRFMFFNPDDIRWFKPVELWTKEGRRGHIRESLGTHGHMKCIFDAPILHSDTICMSLYKRVSLHSMLSPDPTPHPPPVHSHKFSNYASHMGITNSRTLAPCLCTLALECSAHLQT
eukprot:Tamp_07475.p1 GENE.Tamp_07475~~Tamp_07475.p1  ORF type:complete len:726 (+),score=204.51 Tamp_07475:104-2179(+)